ncbi:MAG: SpoIIE family protein phosphatase, partial [Butyrivibrio sp.]|nr:SpoIIE family protein phosphatase [Butyrivibrio sp.]
MKIIRGIKFGGLQQKIFNLILIFILTLIGAYTAVGVYQQRNLAEIVQDAASSQQEAIVTISGETMQGVLNTSMIWSTEQQAFIADDLFAEVKADVLTLQAFATQLFEHSSLYPRHTVYLPDPANDGRPSVQMLHERGVNPGESDMIGLIANMSETMLSMFASSDKLNSCFVGCADGCILFANDRAGAYVDQNGDPRMFSVRERPWYKQAAEAGELIFTGVGLDAYTNIPGLVCAAPVYLEGELVAVVGVDVFLSLIDEHVKEAAADGSILCVVSDEGEVLFSSVETGVFQPTVSAGAMDLRKSSNHELADFVKKALQENTGMEEVVIDGKSRYICGAPMRTVGWTVLSIVDKDVTDQPMNTMLQQFDDINRDALASFSKGAGNSFRMILILTILILLLAVIGALFLASRVVKPVEHMTARMNELGAGEKVFEMEDVYRTGDEIEVLAQSFELMSKRTKSYIEQITKITAEKERIGTELALATRIQADMLPNIYPAFPDRKEFDIYATMTPAKEVGGDFYDFFLIDDMHLGIVMADVSGKGVPAALFMMISKILVQNVAMTGKSPAEVLQAVNEQICSNNRDEMFVTVWFGILDIATGTVTAANAGHEYP